MISVKLFEFSDYPLSKISHFIVFPGLSYMCFRIASLYLDSKPDSKPVDILSFCNYLLFIPTLLIGPIDRYKRFQADIDKGYDQININNFIIGLQSLKWGIIYKYIFSEIINRYWLIIKSPINLTAMEMIIDMYAYYLYLFFDFAGYSLMAIGFSRMMGIIVPINFNRPFIASNPIDFWRRFHKTLGDWLKDYFFMPFYKYFRSKKLLKPYPLFTQNISLFLTFFLMGCWNGLSKQHIITGILFGVYSSIYNTYKYYNNREKDIIFRTLPKPIVSFLSILLMLNAVAFSLYIFSGRAPFI